MDAPSATDSDRLERATKAWERASAAAVEMTAAALGTDAATMRARIAADRPRLAEVPSSFAARATADDGFRLAVSPRPPPTETADQRAFRLATRRRWLKTEIDRRPPPETLNVVRDLHAVLFVDTEDEPVWRALRAQVAVNRAYRRLREAGDAETPRFSPVGREDGQHTLTRRLATALDYRDDPKMTAFDNLMTRLLRGEEEGGTGSPKTALACEEEDDDRLLAALFRATSAPPRAWTTASAAYEDMAEVVVVMHYERRLLPLFRFQSIPLMMTVARGVGVKRDEAAATTFSREFHRRLMPALNAT